MTSLLPQPGYDMSRSDTAILTHAKAEAVLNSLTLKPRRWAKFATGELSRREKMAAGIVFLRLHLAGKTLAELMARLGHSTPSAPLMYQHASQARDKALAEKLSELAAKG
jgi:hypothetical protein